MGDDQATLDVVAGEMRTGVAAEFPMDWGDFEITVNKDILSRLLSEGHRRLSFGTASSPFLATGGVGRYIAMPIACPPMSYPRIPLRNRQDGNHLMKCVGVHSSFSGRP